VVTTVALPCWSARWSNDGLSVFFMVRLLLPS
jgi:hypothetical protein